MDPRIEFSQLLNRRYFLQRCESGLGLTALASLLDPKLFAAPAPAKPLGILPVFHHRPTAKRVIWLFMADAPSQLDLFDYKPKLQEYFDKDLPDSVRNGQRITTMTSGQKRFPVAPSVFKFAAARQVRRLAERAAAAPGDDRRRHRHRQDGEHRSDQSRPGHHVHPDRQRDPRPAEHGRLAVATASAARTRTCRRSSCCTRACRSGAPTQALFSRLWGSRLPADAASGRALRSVGDPVLYLSNPPGVDTAQPPATCSTAWPSSTSKRLRSQGDPGNRRRASRSTRWPSACRPSCRS